MMRALAFIAALAASPALGQSFALGAGAMKCEKLSEFADLRDGPDILFQWFLGFGTGVNLSGNGARNLDEANPETVLAYMRVACSRKADDYLLSGMIEAYQALPLRQ